MPGSDKIGKYEKLSLSPVVDLALGSLGFFILTLFGGQLYMLLGKYYPETWSLLLTLLGALGVGVGVVERKIRRGQFDWPRLMRIMEAGTLCGLSLWISAPNPLIAQGLAVAIVLVLYQLGYDLADWSEELLFDFAGFKARANWQQKWDIEGYRLYDRHIVGFKKLQSLLLALDVVLVLIWLIFRQVQGWAIGAGLLFFFFQLLFLGVAFYQKKRIFWAIYGYQVEEKLGKRLMSLLLVLTLIVSTLALVLPVKYNPVPWKAIVEFLNQLTAGGRQENNLVFPETGPENAKEDAPEERLNLQVKSSWHVWIFISLVALLGGVLLAVALGFLISLAKDEQYRLQGLTGLIYRAYRFLREFFWGVIGGFKHGLSQVQSNFMQFREMKRFEKLLDNPAEEVSLWQPENCREEIIFLFIQVLKVWQASGLSKSPNVTVGEYLQLAAEKFPDCAVEIENMRGLLEEALYSSHQMSSEQVEVMGHWVQGILAKIES